MFNGEPLVVFQPFIDTATGRIAGVEALARIRNGEGEVHSAGPLFCAHKAPLAQLRRFDRQIRAQALERFQHAPEEWFLSINISPRWISMLRPEQNLPSLKLLQNSSIAPSRLVFEITEQGTAKRRLPEAVKRYRQAGVRVAIDDFGAGHSQLDRVLDLQPDILKLDMGLFQQAARGGHSGEVVKALALMAERTGCWIIAEGVETEAQLDFALECGARYVQGFLFAQGQPEFFHTDTFVQPFAELRDRFVQRKLSNRAKLLSLRQQLNHLMSNLKHWHRLGSPSEQLPQPNAYPWLLRIFQCDRHGTQVSANLEWRDQRWHCDERYIGHNWSWRPYFYQILAEGKDTHRLVLSSIYRDATSNQYCMTAGQFIDNGNRLLLIDIDAAGF